MVKSLQKSEQLLNKLARGEVDLQAQLIVEGTDELSRISLSVNELLLELSKKLLLQEKLAKAIWNRSSRPPARMINSANYYFKCAKTYFL